MEIFHVCDNSSHERNWLRGETIKPALAEVGRPCDVCGNGTLFPGMYPEMSLDLFSSRPGPAPDALLCGAYPLFVVSAAVIEDWYAYGVKGFDAYAMNLRFAEDVAGPEVTMLKYFHIKVTGRCTLDTDAMGVTVVERCPRCDYRSIEPMWGYSYRIIPGSWDSDLFVSDLFPHVVFCNKRVMSLAGRMRRTNFRFSYPETVWESAGSPGIDYLGSVGEAE